MCVDRETPLPGRSRLEPCEVACDRGSGSARGSIEQASDCLTTSVRIRIDAAFDLVKKRSKPLNTFGVLDDLADRLAHRVSSRISSNSSSWHKPVFETTSLT